MYDLKVEALSAWERLAEQGHVDRFYGDESRVNLTPCVPYAWQFKGEEVGLPSTPGGGLSCFALLARDCRCRFATTEHSMDAGFIVEQLDRFSFALARPTVVVLDNAAIHRAKPVQERIAAWQERGLFVAYLPKYSPHLNIVEVLWRKLKYEWLTATDYTDKPTLFYAVWKALAAVGSDLNIAFAPFKHRRAHPDIG